MIDLDWKTDTKIEHQGEFRKRYPHAIIGGVKECGTRALLAFLARHPSECVLLVKKFSFFFFFFCWWKCIIRIRLFLVCRGNARIFREWNNNWKVTSIFCEAICARRGSSAYESIPKKSEIDFYLSEPGRKSSSWLCTKFVKEKICGKTFEEVIFRKGFEPKKVYKWSSKVSVGICHIL